MSFKNEWSKKHKNISYLRENALWIIMDPWYPTPFENDFIKCPHIDSHNEITLNNILNYLPKIKNSCISCPKIINDKGKIKRVNSHKKISNLFNLENNYFKLLSLMDKLKLDDIVYCGFHYGQCILDKPDGVINASKKFNVWVKKDLCCLFPNEITWHEADLITEKYAIII
jgi:hypothetical protein